MKSFALVLAVLAGLGGSAFGQSALSGGGALGGSQSAPAASSGGGTAGSGGGTAGSGDGIGISVASPFSLLPSLTLRGNTTHAGNTTLGSASTDTVNFGGTDFSLSFPSATQLEINTCSTCTVMKIQDNGPVGAGFSSSDMRVAIGTQTAGAALTVVGQNAFGGEVMQVQNSSATGNSGIDFLDENNVDQGTIAWGNDQAGTPNLLFLVSNNADDATMLTNGGNGGTLYLGANGHNSIGGTYYSGSHYTLGINGVTSSTDTIITSGASYTNSLVCYLSTGQLGHCAAGGSCACAKN